MDFNNDFVYLVVNSSTLWGCPLYGLNNDFVYLVVNSSTLWGRHFMDLIITLFT